MRFARTSFSLVVLLLCGARLGAQTPVVSQTVPTQNLVAGGGTSVALDLRNFFSVSGLSGQVVQINTVMGAFNVELLADDAPQTVANFLRYTNRGAYNNSFIHRSVPGFVIQGGGYTLSGTQPQEIAKDPAVRNEFRVPNTRGTVAMAKLGSDPNSATCEWFVNLADNRSNLDNQNGGFTVFARVLGNGMNVVDAIAALQRVNAGSPFDTLPVRNYSGTGSPTVANLIMVSSVATATAFPTGGGPSVVNFTVQNSAPNLVNASLSGSTLNLTTPSDGGVGSATITVRAVETHGTAVETSFTVSVTAQAPAFSTHPSSQTVAVGSTVALNSVATNAPNYQWQLNGVDLVGATTGTLVINNATGVNSGTYRVIARNAAGTTTSNSATLTVAAVPADSAGRLVNLSILTPAGAGSRVLTVGAVVGPVNSPGTLPLLLRAVGPTLQSVFGATGVLGDPQLAFFGAGGTTLGANDDWGGGADLSAAFNSVGAFALTPGSLDSALFRPAPGVNTGTYTVQVSGKGEANGLVLAEIYDAAGNARTSATPRLVNVSVLKVLDPGASLTAGFVLRGETARTVLVRAIGPGLSALGVGGVMSDPQLELFNAASVRIADNDNWGGENFLRAAGTQVGAFSVAASTSRDAMLLVTLAPGNYTARVSGVGGVGGNVIVEVYEVP